MKTAEAAMQNLVRELLPKSGLVLIAGSHVYEGKVDRRTYYPGCECVGIDKVAGPGVDIVQDLGSPPLEIDAQHYDHIDCCSVLEHSENPFTVAMTLIKACKLGGTILISVPFTWRIHNYPGDYWRFSPQSVDLLFPNFDWNITTLLTLDGGRKPRTYNDGHIRYIERSQVVAFGRRMA